MAIFTTWLVRLGNTGAAQNAADACERRRQLEDRVAVTCAAISERYDQPALRDAPGGPRTAIHAA